MASVTLRSSRKFEGLTTRSKRSNIVLGSSHNRLPQQSNIRKKRPRDSFEDEKYALDAKRVKIAIEIDPFPKSQPKTRSLRVVPDTKVTSPRSTAPPAVKASTQTTAQTPAPKPVPHHEKVVNGIKHELDRLQDKLSQPLPPNLKDEKRKLRSQEGQRFKSELSLYFPDYDEIIGNDPKEDRKLLVPKAIEFVVDLF